MLMKIPLKIGRVYLCDSSPVIDNDIINNTGGGSGNLLENGVSGICNLPIKINNGTRYNDGGGLWFLRGTDREYHQHYRRFAEESWLAPILPSDNIMAATP